MWSSVSGKWRGRDSDIRHCNRPAHRLCERDLILVEKKEGGGLTLCNENVHFTGSSFCNLSWKKESGVSWKPDPPSSLNGGIPANTHVLSHVFVRVMFWVNRGEWGVFLEVG